MLNHYSINQMLIPGLEKFLKKFSKHRCSQLENQKVLKMLNRTKIRKLKSIGFSFVSNFTKLPKGLRYKQIKHRCFDCELTLLLIQVFGSYGLKMQQQISLGIMEYFRLKGKSKFQRNAGKLCHMKVTVSKITYLKIIDGMKKGLKTKCKRMIKLVHRKYLSKRVKFCMTSRMGY